MKKLIATILAGAMMLSGNALVYAESDYYTEDSSPSINIKVNTAEETTSYVDNTDKAVIGYQLEWTMTPGVLTREQIGFKNWNPATLTYDIIDDSYVRKTYKCKSATVNMKVTNLSNAYIAPTMSFQSTVPSDLSEVAQMLFVNYWETLDTVAPVINGVTSSSKNSMWSQQYEWGLDTSEQTLEKLDELYDYLNEHDGLLGTYTLSVRSR